MSALYWLAALRGGTAGMYLFALLLAALLVDLQLAYVLCALAGGPRGLRLLQIKVRTCYALLYLAV